jgi:hypothetical protein
MIRTLLFLLFSFQVIQISGQPPERKEWIPGIKKTDGQRKGFLEIKNNLLNSHPDRPVYSGRIHTKSETAITQQLDFVIVEELKTNSNQLEPADRYEFTYNSNGRLIVETAFSWDSGSGEWLPDWKDDLSYNGGGNITELENFVWNHEDEEWNANYRETRLYNARGYVRQINYFLWDGTQQEWSPFWREDFTYDDSGNLTMEIHYSYSHFDQEWEPEWKMESEYDENGNVTENLEFEWNQSAGEWHLDLLNQNLYDADGNLMEGVFYEYDNNNWQLDWKFEYTRDQEGNALVLTYFHYDHNDEVWVPDWKNEYAYDINFNLISDISYSLNGSWVPVQKYEYLINTDFSFDEILTPYSFSFADIFSNMLTEVNIFNYEAGAWVEGRRIVFNYSEYDQTPDEFTLTVHIEGTGNVLVNGSSYSGPVTAGAGTVMNLEAIAGENNQFDGWTGNLASNEPVVSITMNGHRNVTATFSVITSSVIVEQNRQEVYPNPFGSSITINTTEDVRVAAFVNLIGRTVKEVHLSGQGMITIPTGDLDNGIYILILQNRSGERTMLKMIKN